MCLENKNSSSRGSEHGCVRQLVIIEHLDKVPTAVFAGISPPQIPSCWIFLEHKSDPVTWLYVKFLRENLAEVKVKAFEMVLYLLHRFNIHFCPLCHRQKLILPRELVVNLPRPCIDEVDFLLDI